MNIKNLGAQQAHQLNECISEKSDEVSPLPNHTLSEESYFKMGFEKRPTDIILSNHTSSEESYYQMGFDKRPTDIIKNQGSLSVNKTSTNQTVVTNKM